MNKSLIVRSLLATALGLGILGCSTSNPNQAQHNPTTGTHPATWLANHWSAYLADPASCSACHGSATVPAESGGVSGVTCFQCHHPNGPNHPANWGDWSQHGATGAIVAADATPFSNQGMASCQVCHGTDFNTPVGITSTTYTCYSCHTHAPHPDAPWGASANPPAVGTAPRHDQVNPSNVPVCYGCHAAGSVNNPTGLIVTPAAPGTQPGCMNNTMCHGNNPTGLPPS